MSYTTLETSTDGGKPVELYRFIVAGVVYKYTSGQQSVTALTNGGASETYLPVTPITRSKIEQGRELARAALDVTVPRNHPIAQLFVAFVPSSLVLLTIFRQHDGDGDNNFIQYWRGTVKAVEWHESQASLRCEPTLTTLKRKGLRRNYGATCQHAVYSVGGCTIDKEGFRTNAVMDDVDGETLTATEIGATANDQWFPGGFAERTNGEIRFITGQSGDTVTILTPFNNLLAGETVALYAGCDKTINTCAIKFVDASHPDGNEINHMGFHVNPLKNPFLTGLK